MASATLKINGLSDLRAALKKLPDDLKREAGVIVQAQAQQMAVELQAGYPVGPSGNLRSHVRVELAGDGHSASARVLSAAKHSHLYEKGTQSRRWKKNGKSTGVMPAKPTFIPIAVLRRRVMVAALVDVIERAGLTVTSAAV